MKLTDQELERLLSQQAEQAGEIWERSLPEEPESPHVFSKRFARRMRRLIWRRKHPAMSKLTKIAAVLLLCIGIGAGAAFLPRGGMSDGTLEQVTPFDSIAIQPLPDEGTLRQIQPEQPNDGSDTQEPSAASSSTPNDPSKEAGGFAITEPSYLPAGMSAVSRQESETGIIIRYASDTGETAVYTSRYSADPQLSGDGETVSVRGAAAAVFRSNGEENTLEWIDASACYMLAGNLSKDELLNMANSTKK